MKQIMIVLGFCLLGLSLPVSSQPHPYSTPFAAPKQKNIENPALTLKEGMGKLIAFLNENRQSKKEVAAFLENEVAPYFDFKRMALWAAGPMLKRMDKVERRALVERIKRNFLTTLASRLSVYSKQKANVVNVRAGKRQTAVVTVAIANPKGFPARLDFRMHYSKKGWRIFDVAANGSSAVMYYRRTMMRKMRMQRGWNAKPV